jgi:hypothetical protein
MSEFAPPSYTGDPNAARCHEDYFRLGFWGLQCALAWNAIGASRAITAMPGICGDTALALSQEARNRERVKRGEARKTPVQFGDEVMNTYQKRFLDFRRQNHL